MNNNILFEISTVSPTVLVDKYSSYFEVMLDGEIALNKIAQRKIWNDFISILLSETKMFSKEQKYSIADSKYNNKDSNDITIISMRRYFWMDKAPKINRHVLTLQEKKYKRTKTYSILINQTLEITFAFGNKKIPSIDKELQFRISPKFLKLDSSKNNWYEIALSMDEVKESYLNVICICGASKKPFKNCCYRSLFKIDKDEGYVFGFYTHTWKNIVDLLEPKQLIDPVIGELYKEYKNTFNTIFEPFYRSFYDLSTNHTSIYDDMDFLEEACILPGFHNNFSVDHTKIVLNLDEAVKKEYPNKLFNVNWVYKENKIITTCATNLEDKQNHIQDWHKSIFLETFYNHFTQAFKLLLFRYGHKEMVTYFNYLYDFVPLQNKVKWLETMEAALTLNAQGMFAQASQLIFGLFEPIIRWISNDRGLDIYSYNNRTQGYEYKTLGSLISLLLTGSELYDEMKYVFSVTVAKSGTTLNLNLRNLLSHGIDTDTFTEKEFYIGLVLMFLLGKIFESSSIEGASYNRTYHIVQGL